MSVCEKCGTKFEPKASGEVVTTRVLCPACAAARAAEKLRAKAPLGAERAPSASASSLGSPRPSTQPFAPASPVPAQKPAPRPVARAVDEDDDEDGETTRRRPLAGRDRDKRTTMIAMIVAAVVAIGAGGVVYVIVEKNRVIREAAEADAAEQKRIFDHVVELSKQNNREAAVELIAFAEKEEPLWRDRDNSSEIITLVAKAKNLIERDRVRLETVTNMAALEAGLTGLEQLSSGEVEDLRRKLAEIEPRADSMGVEFVARLGKARIDLNRAFAQVLHEEAKSYAAENPDKGRLALQRFTRAEDEIVKIFEEAFKARTKEAPYFQGHFQDIIKESDALVSATFPDEAIDKLPWKDLLSGEQVGFWNAAATKGFAHRIEGGVLTMVGPDPDAGSLGLISIGDREQWRDFVVDLEFTLESGSFELFLRLGGRADGTVHSVEFKSGTDGIVAGKPYVITAKMIGSTVELIYYPEDVQTEPRSLDWMQSRKGGIGFLLTDGTRLKVTRMRVRELRASGK